MKKTSTKKSTLAKTTQAAAAPPAIELILQQQTTDTFCLLARIANITINTDAPMERNLNYIIEHTSDFVSQWLQCFFPGNKNKKINMSIGTCRVLMLDEHQCPKATQAGEKQ